MVNKYTGLKMRLIKMRLMLMRNGDKRTRYLKNKNIFYGFGEDSYYYSRKIPEEPYLVRIHNNVVIAANVNFITHDVINTVLRTSNNDYKETLAQYHMGTIEIFDNVAIGSDVTILYNTKIGPNAIVAAGSVITKDVPEGSIVGGNPARVIGSVEELANKRKKFRDVPTVMNTIEEIVDYYWGKEF